MKRFALILVLCAVLAGSGMLVPGCDDDKSTKPDVLTIADMAGSWQVSKYEVTHQTIPQMTIDFVQLGAVITIEAEESGLFSGQAVMVDPISQQQTTIPFAGTFGLEGDTITGTFIPEIPPYFTSFSGPYTYNGSSLTVTDSNATFDFDGDQQEDPAIAVVVITRQ